MTAIFLVKSTLLGVYALKGTELNMDHWDCRLSTLQILRQHLLFHTLRVGWNHKLSMLFLAQRQIRITLLLCQMELQPMVLVKLQNAVPLLST